jgi:hypothetical protein
MYGLGVLDSARVGYEKPEEAAQLSARTRAFAATVLRSHL